MDDVVETRVATRLVEVAILWNLLVRRLLDDCGSCGMSDTSVSHFDISDTRLMSGIV